jgi:Na+/H+ antiporter NhaC
MLPRLPSFLSVAVALSLVVPGILHPLSAQEEVAAGIVSDAPVVFLGGVPFQLSIEGDETQRQTYSVRTADGRTLEEGLVEAGGSLQVAHLVVDSGSDLPLQIQVGDRQEAVDGPFAPGWFSILPPILAILLALLFKEVITALFAGVWLGSLVVAGYNPLAAVWRTIDTFAVPALADVEGGHTAIIMFSLLLGGMVGVISKNGGTLGIVEAVSPFAKSPRRGKLATWMAGLAIFFDDYANTLIVGNTMRPITDRLRISREKLAYLVDSTAAPVAAIIPISTWVGYEISLINDGFRIAAEQSATNPALAQSLAAASPFAVFIQTIPFLFYPLLALFFVFLTSAMDRDLGPMAQAEQRAARGAGLFRPGAMLATDTSALMEEPKEGTPRRWWNAAIPVLTVIVVVLGGLVATGRAGTGPGASIMDIFGAADPFATLLWGSLAGCIVAMVLSIAQRILTPREAVEAWLGGLRAMVIAMVILVLAWSLGSVTEVLGTAEFLAQVLSDTLPLEVFPVLVFATAAATAFATGTSWGTMAILLPLVIPLTVSLAGVGAVAGGEQYPILLGVISSVLAGAIFGDHCSPILGSSARSSPGPSSATTARPSPTRPCSAPWRRRATTWTTSEPSSPTLSWWL